MYYEKNVKMYQKHNEKNIKKMKIRKEKNCRQYALIREKRRTFQILTSKLHFRIKLINFRLNSGLICDNQKLKTNENFVNIIF